MNPLHGREGVFSGFFYSARGGPEEETAQVKLWGWPDVLLIKSSKESSGSWRICRRMWTDVNEKLTSQRLQFPVSTETLLKQDCYEEFCSLSCWELCQEWKQKQSVVVTTIQKLKPHSNFAQNCQLWLFSLLMTFHLDCEDYIQLCVK